ncbi:MAG: c-type cytochrome domain-containing protein [Pirellulaceae bacterium]
MITIRTIDFITIGVALCIVGVGPHAAVLAEEVTDKVTYEDHAKPIFRQRCFSCHNPNKKNGGLDLTNFTNLLEGGGSGSPIEPGDSSSSYLFALVSHEAEPHMPPNADRISDEELTTLRRWIDGGGLENSSSAVKVRKKRQFDMAVSDPTTGRPARIVMPARMSMQPDVVSDRDTGVTAMATSPWAPVIALAGQRQIVLYHCQSLRLLGIVPFPAGQVNVLRFSRDGAVLLAGGGRGGAGGKIALYDVRTGRLLAEIGDELDAVLAADVSADLSLVALGGPQRLVRVYSTGTGELVAEIKKHTDWITALAFSPDGVLLASSDRNGGLHVWEAANGREYLTLKAHTGAITQVAWRSDSNILASASEDQSIRLWEMENGGQVKNWKGDDNGVLDLRFTRDGLLVSCGRERRAKVWDQNGTQKAATESLDDIALQVTCCDETQRLFVADWTGAIRACQMADGSFLGELDATPPTLENRLAAAREDRDRCQAAHSTASKAAADDQAKLTALEEVQQQLVERLTADRGLAVKKQQEAASAEQEIGSLRARRLQLDNRIAQLNHGLPTLRETLEKAVAAQQALPDDAELKNAAESLERIVAARTSEMEMGQKSLAALADDARNCESSLSELTETIAALQREVAADQQQSDSLRAEIEAQREQCGKSGQEADIAQQRLVVAVDEVRHWERAIEFVAALQSLQAQRTAAEQESSVAKMAVEKLRKELMAQQQRADSAGMKVAEVERAIAELQEVAESEGNEP